MSSQIGWVKQAFITGAGHSEKKLALEVLQTRLNNSSK